MFSLLGSDIYVPVLCEAVHFGRADETWVGIR